MQFHKLRESKFKFAIYFTAFIAVSAISLFCALLRPANDVSAFAGFQWNSATGCSHSGYYKPLTNRFANVSLSTAGVRSAILSTAEPGRSAIIQTIQYYTGENWEASLTNMYTGEDGPNRTVSFYTASVVPGISTAINNCGQVVLVYDYNQATSLVIDYRYEYKDDGGYVHTKTAKIYIQLNCGNPLGHSSSSTTPPSPPAPKTGNGELITQARNVTTGSPWKSSGRVWQSISGGSQVWNSEGACRGWGSGNDNNWACDHDSESEPEPVWAKPNDRIQFRHENYKEPWLDMINWTDVGEGCSIAQMNYPSSSSPAMGGSPRSCDGTNTISTGPPSTALASIGRAFHLWSPSGGAGPDTNNEYSITADDTGRKFRQQMSTGVMWAHYDGTSTVYWGGPGASYATVMVPYNYTTTTSVTGEPGNPADSGTNIDSVTATLTINNRSNSMISSSPYATRTYSTEWHLVQFLVPSGQSPSSGGEIPGSGGKSRDDICRYYRNPIVSYTYEGGEEGGCRGNSRTETFNGTGSSTLNIPPGFVPDVPVGTQVCFAVAVWPASSWGGREANQSTESANRAATNPNPQNAHWHYSQPRCTTVGKKPKVAFLGAGVNVPIGTDSGNNGTISTSQTRKPWAGGRLYSSWSEYEAVAGRTIRQGSNDVDRDGVILPSVSGMTGIATGAATGNYGLSSAGISRPSTPTWSKQTITNTKENSLGNYNRPSLPNLSIRFGAGCPPNTPNCQNELPEAVGGVIRIPRGETRVWVTGSTTLNNNIEYEPGTYSNLNELPQAIIIVNGDLHISGNVTQIDAWVIVEGTLYTCNETGSGTFGISTANLTSDKCGRKLVFNGPVVARNVQLRRTAGSGVNNSLRQSGGVSYCHTGLNSCASTGPSVYHYYDNTKDASGDPAEVFNLRADAYLWSLNQAITNSQVSVTHTREAAPRF
jgi:hypothetical protein